MDPHVLQVLSNLLEELVLFPLLDLVLCQQLVLLVLDAKNLIFLGRLHLILIPRLIELLLQVVDPLLQVILLRGDSLPFILQLLQMGHLFVQDGLVLGLDKVDVLLVGAVYGS